MPRGLKLEIFVQKFLPIINSKHPTQIRIPQNFRIRTVVERSDLGPCTSERGGGWGDLVTVPPGVGGTVAHPASQRLSTGAGGSTQGHAVGHAAPHQRGTLGPDVAVHNPHHQGLHMPSTPHLSAMVAREACWYLRTRGRCLSFGTCGAKFGLLSQNMGCIVLHVDRHIYVTYTPMSQFFHPPPPPSSSPTPCTCNPPPPLGGDYHLAQKAYETLAVEGAKEIFSLKGGRIIAVGH